MSKFITCWMSGKSSPLAAMSVATSTSLTHSLYSRMASFLSAWSLPPWMDTASTPLSSRYSCMSSTSLFLSQNMITGGAVFCRHSSRYTIFASFFTYSTSWITSRFAAPALPTFTSKGLTSVFFAKSWNFCGMVAEKRMVCRGRLNLSMMLCTSSSKPRSSIRSPSSRHRYLQMSMFSFFFVRWSFSRPGVATMQCTPYLCALSTRSLLDSPPITRAHRISGLPAFLKVSQKCCTFSYVCLASSLLGQRISPRGPSFPSRGMLSSSSRANMTMGRAKVSVFPDPVNAMPMMSRPESSAGMPCTWMGVGRVMPLALSASSMAGGIFMSAKLFRGGGQSSPSTRMCHFFLVSSWKLSGLASMCLGARQVVTSGSVRRVPVAISSEDMRAFVETWLASFSSAISLSFCCICFSSPSPIRARSSFSRRACSSNETLRFVAAATVAAALSSSFASSSNSSLRANHRCSSSSFSSFSSSSCAILRLALVFISLSFISRCLL
mmetsp:Transcript_24391/g.52801  ORF Transcript_24391/g.52801 Transcript_24391/m.52801 type:complete len:495 (-) Transcript_24391:161-1645(-)